MRDMYMRSGQGFLLVYDVTNRASFAEVPVFRNQILTAKDAESVPLVIIGNKCDIEDAREVSTADGMELAKSFGAEFFEGSAKFRKNVDEAFFAVVNHTISHRVLDASNVYSRTFYRFASYVLKGSENKQQSRKRKGKQLPGPPHRRNSFARYFDSRAPQ